MRLHQIQKIKYIRSSKCSCVFTVGLPVKTQELFEERMYLIQRMYFICPQGYTKNREMYCLNLSPLI